MKLIEFPRGVWLDADAIEALQPSVADTGWTRVLLAGGKELRVQEVPSTVAAKINDARNPEGQV